MVGEDAGCSQKGVGVVVRALGCGPRAVWSKLLYSSSSKSMPSKTTKREEEKRRRRRRRRRGRRRAITDAHRRPSQKIRKRGRHDDTHRKGLRDAVRWAKDTEEGGGATKTFDQTVEMSIRLGVNPKRSDMIVRGTCNLPNGTGKNFTCWRSRKTRKIRVGETRRGGCSWRRRTDRTDQEWEF